MLSFKLFLEKKTYTLTSKENEQVEDIVNIYRNTLFKNKNKDITIGNIEYYNPINDSNKRIDVVVNFANKPGVRGAYYENPEQIVLYYNEFNNLSDNLKHNTIVHELLHAKQHYRKYTSYERQAVHKRGRDNQIRSQRGYYLGNVELPIQIASITHELERQYLSIIKNIKQGRDVQYWERHKNNFLKTLESFIRADSLKDISLPSYLRDQTSFIETLYRNKNNPKYSRAYKSFKSKLYWYYDNLKNIE